MVCREGLWLPGPSGGRPSTTPQLERLLHLGVQSASLQEYRDMQLGSEKTPFGSEQMAG